MVLYNVLCEETLGKVGIKDHEGRLWTFAPPPGKEGGGSNGSLSNALS